MRARNIAAAIGATYRVASMYLLTNCKARQRIGMGVTGHAAIVIPHKYVIARSCVRTDTVNDSILRRIDCRTKRCAEINSIMLSRCARCRTGSRTERAGNFLILDGPIGRSRKGSCPASRLHRLHGGKDGLCRVSVQDRDRLGQLLDLLAAGGGLGLAA